MNIITINQKLSEGEIENPGIFPHLTRLNASPYQFKIDFGLPTLPTEPGILLIRGARQYGKSTWLEQQLKKSIQEFGAGSAFYLNGENLLTVDKLQTAIENLLPTFIKDAPVRRIFIDEITAIANWELALKRLADANQLSDVLLITTGSKATDLRRGAERLPGRKGKLARTNYLFTPISFAEFKRICGKKLKEKTLPAYIISGGSPIACAEIAEHGTIPEYVIELVRDWIEGEVSASGRSRTSLANIFKTLFRFGSSTVGQAKLARESGLANNTIAAGYIELLSDLGCVLPAFPFDHDKKILILRKPCKYHFSNLLAATAYHPDRMRSPDDFLTLPAKEQGVWYEWVISQELLRRSAIQGQFILDPQAFWQSKEHEIDFVSQESEFIEVKRGRCTPHEFVWFNRQFKHARLTVVNQNQFQTEQLSGVTLEDFLSMETDCF